MDSKSAVASSAGSLSVHISPKVRLPVWRRGRHTRVHDILFTPDDEIAIVLGEFDDQRPLALNRERQRLQAFDLNGSLEEGKGKDRDNSQGQGTPVEIGSDVLKSLKVRGRGGVAIGGVETVFVKGHFLSKHKVEVHHSIAVCYDSTIWGKEPIGLSNNSETVISAHDGGTYIGPISVEIFTLCTGSNKTYHKRLSTLSNPIVSPIAFSPDGKLLAGVSGQEPSEIILLDTDAMAAPTETEATIQGHLAPVALFQFMPDGNVVSLATDGIGRLCTSQQSDRGAPGALIKQFRIDTKYPPSLLRVSPDGELVVSVWGRQVVLWYPYKGTKTGYNLDEERSIELWPLAISPNCRLMVCRSERGVDIIDVLTGQSCRHATWDRTGNNAATAAAISHNGTVLAVGLQNGAVVTYNLMVDVEPNSKPVTQEDAPPAYTKVDS